jgi:hypothetical protein
MRFALTLLLLALLAAPAAAAPKVTTMVVGKDRVLAKARTVTAKKARVKVGGHRCTVARATPLAALARLGLTLKLRDYGSCGRRAADAGGLFVSSIDGDRNRGRNGWVYKLGRKVPSLGAADTSGRRLRGGDRLLWFWCRTQSSGGCQRTLEARPESAAEVGTPLRVIVRGYDDNGRGRPIEGATVKLGASTGTTDVGGVATVTVPGSGRLSLSATADGLVPSFPRVVIAG